MRSILALAFALCLLPSALLAQDLQIAGKIVFDSPRTGNREIFIMNADGTNQTNLTNNSLHDNWGRISPDGTTILFHSNRTGNSEVFVMNVDGTGVTNLTNNAAPDNMPAWSPDGTKIAFYSSRSGSGVVWVMNADGSNPTALTSINPKTSVIDN